jgi:hypothetical protein
MLKHFSEEAKNRLFFRPQLGELQAPRPSSNSSMNEEYSASRRNYAIKPDLKTLADGR